MQDTGDTRETPAIDVCKGLMADNARINIYDPKVTEAQIHNDLSLDKFMWDHPQRLGRQVPTPELRHLLQGRLLGAPPPACQLAPAAQHP